MELEGTVAEEEEESVSVESEESVLCTLSVLTSVFCCGILMLWRERRTGGSEVSVSVRCVFISVLTNGAEGMTGEAGMTEGGSAFARSGSGTFTQPASLPHEEWH